MDSRTGQLSQASSVTPRQGRLVTTRPELATSSHRSRGRVPQASGGLLGTGMTHGGAQTVGGAAARLVVLGNVLAHAAVSA